MSTQFNPTPQENTSYTEVADGDNLIAASVTVAFEGLENHGAWLGQLLKSVPVLNWGAAVAPPTPASMKRGVYSPSNGVWFGVGETGMDYCIASGDSGATWTAITIAGGSGLGTFDVAADASGNIAITNASSRTVYYRTPANVWTVSAAQLGATGGAQPYIAFDTTNSKWVAAFRDGATGIKVYVSTNGTTWAASAASAATWAASTDVPKMGAGAGAMLVVHGSANSYYMAVGPTTGASWTETNITTTITPTSFTRPVWDAYNAVWVVTFASASQSEVWTSSNGIAWARKALWTVTAMQTIAPLGNGSLLLAIDTAGISYYSLDAGVTWRLANAPLFPSATATVLAAGGGMFMAYESTITIKPSLRLGPGPVVTP